MEVSGENTLAECVTNQALFLESMAQRRIIAKKTKSEPKNGRFYKIIPSIKISQMKGVGSPLSRNTFGNNEIIYTKGWLKVEDCQIGSFMKKVVVHLCDISKSSINIENVKSVSDKHVSLTLQTYNYNHASKPCSGMCEKALNDLPQFNPDVENKFQHFCAFSWIYPKTQKRNGNYDISDIIKKPWYMREDGNQIEMEVWGEIGKIFIGDEKVKLWMTIDRGHLNTNIEQSYDPSMLRDIMYYQTNGKPEGEEEEEEEEDSFFDEDLSRKRKLEESEDDSRGKRHVAFVSPNIVDNTDEFLDDALE